MGRGSRKALAATGAIVLALCVAAPLALAGKHKPPPPPKLPDLLERAITVHNTAIDIAAAQVAIGKSDGQMCLQDQQNDPPDYSNIDGDGQTSQTLVDRALRPWNRLLAKITELVDRDLKPKSDKAQKRKEAAVKDLKQAHDLHGKEFFEFDAVNSALIRHDCQGAIDATNRAAVPGRPAWANDVSGLRVLASLLNVKKDVENPQPYLGL